MSHDMHVKVASKFRLSDYHFELEKTQGSMPGEVYYVIFKVSVKLVGSVGGVVSCCHCKCSTEILLRCCAGHLFVTMNNDLS